MYFEFLMLIFMAMWQMNKGKTQTKEQDPTDNDKKAGDLFKAESLEAYAGTTRDDEEEDYSEDETQVVNWECS